jgi:hypothetical protein
MAALATTNVTPMPDQPVSIRIPQELLAKIEEMADEAWFWEEDRLAFARQSRHTALLYALTLGVEQLEEKRQATKEG